MGVQYYPPISTSRRSVVREEKKVKCVNSLMAPVLKLERDGE